MNHAWASSQPPVRRRCFGSHPQNDSLAPRFGPWTWTTWCTVCGTEKTSVRVHRRRLLNAETSSRNAIGLTEKSNSKIGGSMAYTLCPILPENELVKAKFHYAFWFEACRRPASNQLRTRQRNGIWPRTC